MSASTETLLAAHDRVTNLLVRFPDNPVLIGIRDQLAARLGHRPLPSGTPVADNLAVVYFRHFDGVDDELFSLLSQCDA